MEDGNEGRNCHTGNQYASLNQSVAGNKEKPYAEFVLGKVPLCPYFQAEADSI